MDDHDQDKQVEIQNLTFRVAQLEAENEALQSELSRAILRDCDGNEDAESELSQLRLEVAQLRVRVKASGVASCPTSSLVEYANVFDRYKGSIYPTLLPLIEDQGMIAEIEAITEPIGTMQKLHKSPNILCSCLIKADNSIVTVSAAASKTVVLSQVSENNETIICSSMQFDAPVVLLKANPRQDKDKVVLAAGLLDGNVILLQAYKSGTTWCLSKAEIDIYAHDVQVPSIKHEKHVTDLVWSSCGRWLASASRDQHVFVSCFLDNARTVQLAKDMHCTGCPESLAFINAFDALCLAVAVRDNTCLHVLVVDDLPDGVQRYSEALGKERDPAFTLHRVPLFGGQSSHVSFSILAMAPAPNLQPFIVCATDKHRHIVYETVSFKVLRDLYGHSNGGYGRPRIAWSTNGSYIVSNSETEPEVCIWYVATGQLARKLRGHKQSVRDVSILEHGINCDIVSSCSFDGTCRQWTLV